MAGIVVRVKKGEEELLSWASKPGLE